MSSRSRTRFARLADVFPYDPKNRARNNLHAQIARLCVIWEDLRFELRELFRDGPDDNDEFTKAWKETYFFRRSIGTLNEVSDAVVSLDAEPEFRRVKDSFKAEEKKKWDAAVAHFKSKKWPLKDIRNDIGGHFGLKAALCAVERLSLAERGRFGDVEGSIGQVEWHRDATARSIGPSGSGIPLRLHFASHIACAAILRDPPTEGYSEALDRLVRELWMESYSHAYPVLLILHARVWQRFGG